MKTRNWIRLMLPLLVLMLGASGCIFSPDDDPTGPGNEPEEPEYPKATEPDILMDNFQAVYEDRDLNTYRDVILNENYKFMLQDDTVTEFGLPDDVYIYEEEIAIAEHMFSEAPSSNGKVISSIEFELLEPQGVWQDVPEEDPDFGGETGAQKRTYNLRILFHIQGENFQYAVEGLTIFYVIAHEEEIEGVTRDVYQLLGQVDLTDG